MYINIPFGNDDITKCPLCGKKMITNLTRKQNGTILRSRRCFNCDVTLKTEESIIMCYQGRYSSKQEKEEMTALFAN